MGALVEEAFVRSGRSPVPIGNSGLRKHDSRLPRLRNNEALLLEAGNNVFCHETKLDLRIHSLKIWPEYYAAVSEKRKTFEFRFNDRGFRVGDWLLLNEFDNIKGRLTNRLVVAEVTYMLEGNGIIGIPDGHVVMAIRLLE